MVLTSLRRMRNWLSLTGSPLSPLAHYTCSISVMQTLIMLMRSDQSCRAAATLIRRLASGNAGAPLDDTGRSRWGNAVENAMENCLMNRLFSVQCCSKWQSILARTSPRDQTDKFNAIRHGSSAATTTTTTASAACCCHFYYSFFV